MPVMDIRHVSVLMLDARMSMLMRMRFSGCLVHIFVPVKFIGPGMSVFVHHGHVNVKMGVLFICQEQRARCHQGRGKDK